MTTRSSHEYSAISGLQKEITIETKNTTGTASPWAVRNLACSSSMSSGTRRWPLLAFQETLTSSKLATAASAA